MSGTDRGLTSTVQFHNALNGINDGNPQLVDHLFIIGLTNLQGVDSCIAWQELQVLVKHPKGSVSPKFEDQAFYEPDRVTCLK
jgi:hypothetical protein